MACTGCGGVDIEHDTAAGMSYCRSCGEVCEENTIVSEVTFGEAASGAAIVQGSFIRAGQTRANMTGPGRFGSGQESREMTLYQSRRRIQRLATAMELSEHFVDSAQRYFQLALNQNMTRGRRAIYVSAACLYIVCRTEKTSQMLIDFSDILHVSVFKLGATFAKLVNALNLRLPIVDPSLYISRFASMLEFGEKTQLVSMEAIRLVQRMDRDWIRTGRRPAGICGACLLIAARMHNFRRTQKEIIKVVKIADTTLRRRLDEFRMTPSGKLTVAHFRDLWLEQAADPPAFTNNRAKARKAMMEQQKLRQAEGPGSTLRRVAQTGSHLPTEEQPPAEGSDAESESSDTAEFEDTVDRAFAEEFAAYLNTETLKFISTESANANFNADVSTWSDMDDDEVSNIMLNEEEVRLKTEIWDRENKEFMEERERKRLAREQEESMRKRRKSTRKRVSAPGATPLESAQNMLATRRLSKKINYEVLGRLLDNESSQTQTAPTYSGMVPSGAPSRMLSVAGTPMHRSGYATPTQETLVNTQLSTIAELPAALASVAADKGEAAETIVYEEGHHDLQSPAVAATAADAFDGSDEDEEYSDEDHDHAIAYDEDPDNAFGYGE
ncbi:transcription factor TFIIIB subunit brf1 [Coemansia sp. RSA 2336]|nr:transcription factor TFIIIB subunit brf1 [Coemansia sp. RSA 2336]